MSYMVWFGVALGSMAWLMIQYLSGGAWGVVTRRIFEASSRTLPFMAVLFLPIAFGVHDLYLWSHPDVVATDEILQHREPYMNLSFFYARAVIYFVSVVAAGVPPVGVVAAAGLRARRSARASACSG